jgi:hypothetical protein
MQTTCKGGTSRQSKEWLTQHQLASPPPTVQYQTSVEHPAGTHRERPSKASARREATEPALCCMVCLIKKVQANNKDIGVERRRQRAYASSHDIKSPPLQHKLYQGFCIALPYKRTVSIPKQCSAVSPLIIHPTVIRPQTGNLLDQPFPARNQLPHHHRTSRRPRIPK